MAHISYMRWALELVTLIPLSANAQQVEWRICLACTSNGRGPPAGHRDPALARPGRWNSLLCLSADHGRSFATGAEWLRAVWAEHHRFSELHEHATTHRRGTQAGGKTERRYDAGALKRRDDLPRCVA